MEESLADEQALPFLPTRKDDKIQKCSKYQYCEYY